MQGRSCPVPGTFWARPGRTPSVRWLRWGTRPGTTRVPWPSWPGAWRWRPSAQAARPVASPSTRLKWCHPRGAGQRGFRRRAHGRGGRPAAGLTTIVKDAAGPERVSMMMRKAGTAHRHRFRRAAVESDPAFARRRHQLCRGLSERAVRNGPRIDRIQDGTLWEEKTATGQDPRMNIQSWVQKNIQGAPLLSPGAAISAGSRTGPTGARLHPAGCYFGVPGRGGAGCRSVEDHELGRGRYGTVAP